MVPTVWRALIDHILTVDKHLIPFTGADRYNDNFVISGRLKGGTYQFWPDCAAFSGSTTPTMAMSTTQPCNVLAQDTPRYPATGKFRHMQEVKSNNVQMKWHQIGLKN